MVIPSSAANCGQRSRCCSNSFGSAQIESTGELTASGSPLRSTIIPRCAGTSTTRRNVHRPVPAGNLCASIANKQHAPPCRSPLCNIRPSTRPMAGHRAGAPTVDATTRFLPALGIKIRFTERLVLFIEGVMYNTSPGSGISMFKRVRCSFLNGDLVTSVLCSSCNNSHSIRAVALRLQLLPGQ
jgi:hypothetical protein